MLADKLPSKNTVQSSNSNITSTNGNDEGLPSSSILHTNTIPMCRNAIRGGTSIVKDTHEPEKAVVNWTVDDVKQWLKRTDNLRNEVNEWVHKEMIDGRVLLALTENDIRDMRFLLNYSVTFGELKKLWLSVSELQDRYLATTTTAKLSNQASANNNFLLNGTFPLLYSNSTLLSHNTEATPVHRKINADASCYHHTDIRDIHMGNSLLPNSEYIPNMQTGGDSEAMTPPMSIDSRAVTIPPEFFKTFISLGYSFLVTWITSFVMVIVHERVPDMKRYPPLPDIFLDNVPHIPWAFHMCEITGTLLFAIWSCVCIFHKYRMVLLRRFFALAGTVFLLRCVTMLITSLSVPGTHLQCDQSDYAVDDTDLTLTEALELRISRAYTIWSGLGMSIQGVRTCGDYMFSGHTVALTLLNFFITEYTPRNLYFLHTLTWLLNMFGIFFILAAHEHYSIDVFVAFYITSRLFLYYHTLANNQALMSRDSTRTRIWFPMFSYFENSVDGIIPNEFDTVSSLLDGLLRVLMDVKDSIMMTAQRLNVDPPQLALATKNLLLNPVCKEHHHITNQAATTSSLSSSTTTTVNSRILHCTTKNTNADEETRELLNENATGVTATLSVNYETTNSNATGNICITRSPKSSSNNLNNNDTISFITTAITNLPDHNTDNANDGNLQALTTDQTKKLL